jgi:hypothetical protein
VRIGHYASGCADVDPLAPGSVHDAPVTVLDVPMALPSTSLRATLTFVLASSASDAWRAAAASAAGRVEAAFFPAGTGEGTLLLDAMRASIAPASDQVQYDQLRASGGWDGVAQTWLDGRARGVRATASDWLGEAARADLGPLIAHVGNATNAVPAMAPVSVTTLSGLPPASAAITPTAPFTLAADADDTVHLSGAIGFASTPYVAHLADARASAAVDGAVVTDVPSAIALAIDCVELAMKLVAGGVSHGTCDAACTGALCGAALSAAWAGATTASPSGADAVRFAITASAPAEVGDHAEPLFVQGGWLGQASGPGVPTPFPLAGELVATEHAP